MTSRLNNELISLADVPRYVAPTVQEEPLTGYKIRYWESDKDVSQANDTTVYIGSYDFKLEVGYLASH